jgi:crossover junction endodeoxyribonuclease RuvC
MVVLGIDPGSHATGYGVVATDPVVRMVAGGVIRPDQGADLPARLLTIYDGVAAILARYSPQQMAVEALFNARNARSSLVLGHARGVVLLAGARAAVPVVEYAPAAVKRSLTGNGGASKSQVRFMVRRMLALEAAPALDASDALAVALAHLSRSGRRFVLAAGGRP